MLPAIKHRLHRWKNHLIKISQPGTRKSRLLHPAVTQPVLSIAGQQPAPGDGRQGVILNGIFAVIVMIILQHAADKVGMVDEENLRLPQRKPDQIAIALRTGV